MKRTTIAALAAAILLIAPRPVRADEWERVPTTGGGFVGGGGEAATPARAISDGEAVENVRTQLGGAQAPCEIIGLLAATAATARDQAVPQERQAEDMDCTFSRAVAGTHTGLEWSRSFDTLMKRIIAYVYRHPELSGPQAMVHWTRICESPAPAPAAEQPAAEQPPVEQPAAEQPAEAESPAAPGEERRVEPLPVP